VLKHIFYTRIFLECSENKLLIHDQIAYFYVYTFFFFTVALFESLYNLYIRGLYKKYPDWSHYTKSMAHMSVLSHVTPKAVPSPNHPPSPTLPPPLETLSEALFRAAPQRLSRSSPNVFGRPKLASLTFFFTLRKEKQLYGVRGLNKNCCTRCEVCARALS